MTDFNYGNPQKAVCYIKGNTDYPDVKGEVYFFITSKGLMIETVIYGLDKEEGNCTNDFCAMHIHNGTNCDIQNNDYINIKGHYNVHNCKHPMHIGDLLPIIKNTTISFSQVLYTKFNLEDLIGKFIIIHEHHDDFTTDPSGQSGKKIACGQIVRI